MLGEDARGRAYVAFPQFYDDGRVLRTVPALPSSASSSVSVLLFVLVGASS